MKRITISVTLIFSLLFWCVACDKGSDNTPISNNEKNVYELLDELSSKEYNKIQLKVTTLTGGIELKANYIFTNDKVDYSIEQLNLLPHDGDLIGASSEYKTTVCGSATVENGKITKMDGVAVALPSCEELKGRFNFRQEYFASVQIENEKFSADVINASAFLDTDKTITDMKIVVEYNSSAFQKITITYIMLGSSVTTVYVFEK